DPFGDGTRGAARGAVRGQPGPEPLEAFDDRNARAPARSARERPVIGDVEALVADPPGAPFEPGRAAGEVADELDQLEKADRVCGAAADVEGAAGELRAAFGRQKRVDEILDEEDVAHLPAVAVERDGLALHRTDEEVGDPALVLG